MRMQKVLRALANAGMVVALFALLIVMLWSIAVVMPLSSQRGGNKIPFLIGSPMLAVSYASMIYLLRRLPRSFAGCVVRDLVLVCVIVAFLLLFATGVLLSFGDCLLEDRIFAMADIAYAVLSVFMMKFVRAKKA